MEHKHKQGICPVCGNEELSYGSLDFQGDQLGYDWYCDDCQSTGTEWYALTFIGHENIEERTEGAEFEQEN